MNNQIVINHSYSNGSIGGCYYANYYGPNCSDVIVYNEAGMIESAAPALCGGSHGLAKRIVMETAERVARITGAKIVDRTK